MECTNLELVTGNHWSTGSIVDGSMTGRWTTAHGPQNAECFVMESTDLEIVTDNWQPFRH